MRRRSGVIRVLKWAFTTLCVVGFAGCCCESPSVRYVWGQGDSGDGIWFNSTGIGYISYVVLRPSPFARGVTTRPIGWSVGESLEDVPFCGTVVGIFGVRVCGISTAALVVAMIIPTASFWFLDRRRCFPPGHCRRCGYDLTGNISGRCPECGTVMTLDRGDS